jgi:hypothetical protein
MNDSHFFTHPRQQWQRRYEALRSSFVERLPARAVADRFNYSQAYVNLLRHLFISGKIDFSEPVPEGLSNRHMVDVQTRQKIRQYRENGMSAGKIAQCLSEEENDVSVRTIERVLREEGFPKLPRRTRLQIGMTAKGTTVHDASHAIRLEDLGEQSYTSDHAGLFLFAPLLAQLDIDSVIAKAGIPGSKVISAKNYLYSFLALKLVGTERYGHVGKHAFDSGMGLFAGLNVLPKVTAMSTYSHSLDDVHNLRLQQEFVKQGQRLGLYDGKFVNLDFHTIPHYGEESVLEKHWAGGSNCQMLCMLTYPII